MVFLDYVIELGEISLDETSPQTSCFVENLFSNKEAKAFIIAIEFDDKFKYVGCSLEGFNYNKKDKYLYRKKSPNGPDFSPTAKVGANVERTFENKIVGWFKDYKNNNDELIMKIKEEVIERERSNILNHLKNILNDLKGKYKKVKVAITLKVDGKYVGDIDNFVNFFNEEFRKRQVSHKSKGKISGKGTCMHCGKKTDVSPLGVSNVFPFATVEKIGFTTHFSIENSWKNIPLCLDCANNLSRGKIVLDNNFNFNLSKTNFYVIPRFIFPDREENKKILYGIIDAIEDMKKEEKIETLICEEDILSEEVKKQKDILSFVYLFYKKDGNRVIIFGVSEEVYPSWLNNIFKKREECCDYEIFKEEFLKNIFGKNWSGDLKFTNFEEEFNQFFSESNIKANIINDILSKNNIPKHLIIKSFFKALREKYKNINEDKLGWVTWNKATLNSIKILIFLRKLGLLEGENMENEWEKKASFATGVLVSKLINYQYKRYESESTPFIKKLHGLRLDEGSVKKIFTEAKTKLMEYGVAYPRFEEIAADALLKSKDEWHLSPEAISFYFACGLCLGKGIENAEELEKIFKEVF